MANYPCGCPVDLSILTEEGKEAVTWIAREIGRCPKCIPGDWDQFPKRLPQTGCESTTEAFHGTAYKFDNFDFERYNDRVSFGNEKYVYFTSDDGLARAYAKYCFVIPPQILALGTDEEIQKAVDECARSRGCRSRRDMALRQRGTRYLGRANLTFASPWVGCAGKLLFRFAMARAVREAERDGHDGVILHNVVDPPDPRSLRPATVYAVSPRAVISDLKWEEFPFDEKWRKDL